MLRDDADSAKAWEENPYQAFDDDEATADGMVDDDDIFELIVEPAARPGRPESSWDAVVENLSRIREGQA